MKAAAASNSAPIGEGRVKVEMGRFDEEEDDEEEADLGALTDGEAVII